MGILNPGVGNFGTVTITGGSIDNTTIGATTPSTGAFTWLSTNSSTSSTPVLSFDGSNTALAQAASVPGSYLQNILQNRSGGVAGSSTNYVASNNIGTDSSYYGEFGINSSVFSSGTPSDFYSINSGVYFSGHDGDISVGSGNGFKTYLTWGTAGQSAHVINAAGAIGFSTNLASSVANTGTIGYGTSGALAVTQGSGGPAAWSTNLTWDNVNYRLGIGTASPAYPLDVVGTINSTTQILNSVSQSPYTATPLFGTGADGAVTISSGTTTLTRDMQYTNLTINGSGAINTNGYRVFVSGTLDISAAAAGAIQYNSPVGNNASGATGGAISAFGNPAGTTPGIGYVANTGGTGNTTTGTAGSNSIATVSFSWACGTSGAGGAGGAGISVGATGITGTAVNSATVNFSSLSTPFVWLWGGNSAVSSIVQASVAGGGGGQGGGDGVNAGGGGGSPSFGAGMVYVSARFINRGASTAVGAIQAKSGAGGNGANGVGGTAGGGGGGGAGTGGTVIIIVESLLGTTATNAIDVSGGAGGNGGNSPATNKGGTGGRGGGTGSFYMHILSPATYTVYAPLTSGSFATTATTTAGTTGGAGATARANL